MSKRSLFGRMVDPAIWNSLHEVYGVKWYEPSEKQSEFVRLTVDRLYEMFGDRLTANEIRELTEKFDGLKIG